MDPQQLLKSLNSALQVNAVISSRRVKKADHQGYHHSPYDWWLYDAFTTSPKTCELCKALNLTDWRGDWIPKKFPYHRHVRINMIKASLHKHCRCRLHWVGRSDVIYNAPHGYSKIWRPTGKELERLSPSQLEYIMQFLRGPWTLA